jgi:hypothetical protein
MSPKILEPLLQIHESQLLQFTAQLPKSHDQR